MTEDDELLKQLQKLKRYKAPAHLQEKLMALPEEHPRKPGFYQRFRQMAPVGIAAAILVLAVGHFYEGNRHEEGGEYTTADIHAAKQDLALAFHYLNSVSQRTSQNLNHLVVDSSTQAVYQGMFYPLIEARVESSPGKHKPELRPEVRD